MAITKAADAARDRSHVLDDLMFISIMTAIGVFGFPGMSMMELTCGFVLGFEEAFFVTLFAVVGSSCLAFFMGRYYLKDAINAYLASSELHTMKLFLKSIEKRNGVVLLILFRLMLIPLFVKNYGPSVIKTDFLHYLIAVLVTTPVYVAVLTYLGSRAKTIAEIATGGATGGSGITWVEIVPIVVSLAAGVVFTYLAYLEFKKLSGVRDEEERRPVLDESSDVEGQPIGAPTITSSTEPSSVPVS